MASTKYATASEWTHETLEALYRAEGYGCKNCDAPTSTTWWECAGDKYCDASKRAMSAELGRLPWRRIETDAQRAERLAR